MSCSGYGLSQDYGPVAFESEPPLFGFAHFHSGWDLVCPAGTPVSSVTAGLAHVESSAAGFGISVVVSRGDLHVRYAHLAELLVATGDAVIAGQDVGREGSSGNSTGPHLHFEVDRGCALPRCSINPAALIANPAEGHGR
jgi:murein DD-endopeptidase MepM/ murein hydrolase activator NlpD